MSPHCPMCPTGHFRFTTKDGVLTEKCDVPACGFSRRVTPFVRPSNPGRVEAVCAGVGCATEFSYARQHYFRKDGTPKVGRIPPTKCGHCAREHAGRIGGRANVAVLRGRAA